MRWLLLLPLAVPAASCSVGFDTTIQEVLNGTVQELCEILIQNIAIEDSGATHVCLQERYSGTSEDTSYGPLALAGDGTTEVSTMAVAEREVGTARFTPFFFPFRGSVLTSKYTLWPAVNDTFCGEAPECNTTKFVNVDVFECSIPPPTPSPSPLLMPTTAVPSQSATTFAPVQSASFGGGVMATRPPSFAVDEPIMDPPAAAIPVISKVSTKSPNKAPVAPSPTAFPLFSPPSPPAMSQATPTMSQPTTPTSAGSSPPVILTIPAIQGAPSGGDRTVSSVALFVLLLLAYITN